MTQNEHKTRVDPARRSRRQVVRRLTETIVACADALEHEAPRDGIDPLLLRTFVASPVYTWVCHDFIAGTLRPHLLTKVSELLIELCPVIFDQPSENVLRQRV